MVCSWSSVAGAGVLVVALIAACSSPHSNDGRLRVVASTDVYRDIASAVAGTGADVSAFIDDPSQDPHSFESDARDQLALAKADVIVENGGGYDDFVDRMRSVSSKPGSTLINVVRLSGTAASVGGELNEHVWYDLPTVRRFVSRLVAVLAEKDPADRASFRTRAAKVDAQLRGLEATEAAIRASQNGDGVAITEPVPLYLLAACGLTDRTPAAFSHAIEAGSDVPASVLKQTLALFSAKAVRGLFYNAQTAGPATDQVIAAARTNGVPTVPMTETLPAGASYVGWMRSNLAAVAAALAA